MIKWTFDKVQAWATRGFKDNYSKLPNQASITFRQDTRGIFTFGRNVAKAISPMVLIGRIRSTDTSLTSLLDIYARVEGESEVVIGLTEYFVGLYSIFDVGHIDLMEPFAKISKGSADSDRPALLALRIGFIVYYYLIAAGYLGTIPSQIVCRYQDRDYHTFTVSGDFDVEFKVACAVIAASSTVQNNTRDANQKRTIDFDNSGSKDGWRKQMARNLSGNSYIFGELESSSQAPAAPKRRKVNTGWLPTITCVV
jgi:hypothetical protein